MITQRYLEDMAARLAERLAQDIEESKTREEHIRTTARANEAAELLVVIRSSAVNQQKVKKDAQMEKEVTDCFWCGEIYGADKKNCPNCATETDNSTS